MQTVISLYLLAKQVMSDNFFMPAHSKGPAVVYIPRNIIIAKKNANNGLIFFANASAGIPTFHVISMFAIKAIQQIVAVPNIATADSSIPLLTSPSLFLEPISDINGANQRITKPAYDTPEATGLLFPT